MRTSKMTAKGHVLIPVEIRDRLGLAAGVLFRVEVDDEGKIVLVPEERQEKHRRPSVADGAVEVRRVCAEEGYVFEVPERRNRPNSFSNALDDLPR